MADTAFQPLDRDGIAARIARDIPEGWFVNLGIGIPTKVSDFVPPGREVIFHAENGVIGIGPAPAEADINPYLVNAGVQHITMITGAALVHHADSFAIARGGHLDPVSYTHLKPLLVVEGVSGGYGGSTVLDGLNLVVHEGEAVALLRCV